MTRGADLSIDVTGEVTGEGTMERIEVVAVQCSAVCD
jgi:hypothetical protein